MCSDACRVVATFTSLHFQSTRLQQEQPREGVTLPLAPFDGQRADNWPKQRQCVSFPGNFRIKLEKDKFLFRSLEYIKYNVQELTVTIFPSYVLNKFKKKVNLQREGEE